MKVLSVQVGKPRTVVAGKEEVLTGIFKQPVAHRIRVGRLNLEGDAQADLRVHGGPDKAVYAYPSEHYAFWQGVFPNRELGPGAFGENLTTQGMIEHEIHIGDRLQIGSAEFVVTQPRMPCFKLGIKFGDPSVIRKFHESRKSGFYLRVEREGELSARDAIIVLSRDSQQVSITDFYELFAGENPDEKMLRRVLAVAALPAAWREEFMEQVGRPTT